MNSVAKTAVGGLMIALTVVLLLPTMIDLFVYALPALAGLIIMFCVIELNKRWAFGVFAGASAISLIILPNKEAAVLYTAFFGYYPIVKAFLESRLRLPRAVEAVLKLLNFNAAMIVSYFVLIKVMGVPFDQLMGIDGDTPAFLARFAVPVFLVSGNVVFVLYDLLLTNVASLYVRYLQKRFRRKFRFR